MRRHALVGDLLVATGVLLLVGPAAHRMIGLRAQAGSVSPASPSSVRSPGRVRRLADGEAMGRLELPRLGLDLVVFEGTSEDTLRKGPGHLSATARPDGGSGNCVIAGHRDSFFRRLADARRGDVARFHGPSGTSTYRLRDRRIVRPEDLSAIAPTPDARITLITCYPFSWTGSAPYRLVWTAVRLDSASPAAGAEAPEHLPR